MPAWLAVGGLALLLFAPAPAADADDNKIKLEGYLEWRRGDAMLVDGQRVRSARDVEWKGGADAKNPRNIPLGYEVKVEGIRLLDGTVLARKLEARPNGDALFEGELKSGFDEVEQKYRDEGRVFEEDEDGQRENYGRLVEEGRDVDRVRTIVDRLVPPYKRSDEFRVYVVDNKEWNAMAAPNGAIFVFKGLLREMDDDELAIILGHELVHATHEHSRKHFKKDLLIQLAAAGVAVIADAAIDSDDKAAAIGIAALVGATAWSNGYGRAYEDQADRVGLRYSFEAGFDVAKGPRMWRRFADKYGELPKALNFFLSDHSMSRARAANLEREIQNNYRD